MHKKIILKPGREKSLQRRHPWVFSGAIARVEGSPFTGDTVKICAADGSFLAQAAYNAQSQITARVWSWQADEKIDSDFFRTKISDALTVRRTLLPLPLAGEGWGEGRKDGWGEGKNNSARLIHAESDHLPGLIVDQYGDVLVMQIGSAGGRAMARHLCRLPARIVQSCVHLRALRFRFAGTGRSGIAQRNIARHAA